MKIKNKNLTFSFILSLLGTFFLIYYIFRGSTDVVASDYIRIINYYLKDVCDLHLLFSWEGISRIPFTFLARYINVKFFSYSVFFDRILGTFGLFIFNSVVVYFVLNNLKTKIIKIVASVLTTYISFSLISWEMILNGTGYAHFITVGLIAIIFYLYSMKFGDTQKKLGDGVAYFLHIFNKKKTQTVEKKGCAVDAKLGDGVAYFLHNSDKKKTQTVEKKGCAVDANTNVIDANANVIDANANVIDTNANVVDANTNVVDANANVVEKNANIVGANACGARYLLIIIITSLICLILYFKSNNTGEALIPVGFKDITLIQLLKTSPLFPIKFLLKSLASSIIGVETFDYALQFGTISEKMIYFIGFIYLSIIILAIILFFKTILCTGGANNKNEENCIRPYDFVGAHKVRPYDYVGAYIVRPYDAGGENFGSTKQRCRMFTALRALLVPLLIIFTSLLFAGSYAVSFLLTIIFVSILLLIIKRISKNENFEKTVFQKCDAVRGSSGQNNLKKSKFGLFRGALKCFRFIRKSKKSITKGAINLNHSTLFIFIYIIYGLANYLLVFLARYKFVDDTYGMSSRYGIQYMFLTIAVLFIFLKTIDNIICSNGSIAEVNTKVLEGNDKNDIRLVCPCDDENGNDKNDTHLVHQYNDARNVKNTYRIKAIIMLVICIASISFITIGHLTTNTDEIFKADYRKIIYGILEEKAKNYKNLTDEDLENSFEFHRGTDLIREALSTLEDQNLNVFKK